MALQIAPSTTSANQTPYSLERFPLNTLKIWRVLNRATYPVAYVIDADGYMHHVEAGQNIGDHYGRVKKVDTCGLWIVELHQDEKQQWYEQRTYLKSPEFDASARCRRKADQWIKETDLQ